MKGFLKISIILICVVFLVGCNQSSKEIDTSKLSKKIIDEVKFSDGMEKLNDELVKGYYKLPEESEVISYSCCGVYADELTIIESNDKGTSKKIYDSANERISGLYDSYKDYNSKEAKKLKNSIVKQYDRYVIICVTDDISNAENIIQNYMKN